MKHHTAIAVLQVLVAVTAALPQQPRLVQASFIPLPSASRGVFPVRPSRAAVEQLVGFPPAQSSMSSGISVAPGSASAFAFSQNPAPAPAPPPSFVPAPEAASAAVPAPAPASFPPPSSASFAPAPAPAPSFSQAPASAPAPAPAPVIPLLRRTEVHDEAGQYALGFEAGNGIIVSEQGALKKNVDGEWKDDFVLVKQGSYSYPGPDGRVYKLTYTADETGFHPTASYLPVSPDPAS